MPILRLGDMLKMLFCLLNAVGPELCIIDVVCGS